MLVPHAIEASRRVVFEQHQRALVGVDCEGAQLGIHAVLMLAQLPIKSEQKQVPVTYSVSPSLAFCRASVSVCPLSHSTFLTAESAPAWGGGRVRGGACGRGQNAL
jgi:hypothetical protein